MRQSCKQYSAISLNVALLKSGEPFLSPSISPRSRTLVGNIFNESANLQFPFDAQMNFEPLKIACGSTAYIFPYKVVKSYSALWKNTITFFIEGRMKKLFISSMSYKRYSLSSITTAPKIKFSGRPASAYFTFLLVRVPVSVSATANRGNFGFPFRARKYLLCLIRIFPNCDILPCVQVA